MGHTNVGGKKALNPRVINISGFQAGNMGLIRNVRRDYGSCDQTSNILY